MILDVYVCNCHEEFAVKDGKEPARCPFCGEQDIEFSHEVREL